MARESDIIDAVQVRVVAAGGLFLLLFFNFLYSILTSDIHSLATSSS